MKIISQGTLVLFRFWDGSAYRYRYELTEQDWLLDSGYNNIAFNHIGIVGKSEQFLQAFTHYHRLEKDLDTIIYFNMKDAR